MRITPINQIILEGPDLSGKTTLYQKMHEMSNYRWNIQDRSSLSMVVYARLYDRNDYYHVEALKKELSDLNNVFVLLLPDWKIIVERFQKRGDELQNITSLKKVYNLFSEACDEFKDYPNFVVIRSEASDDLISGLVEDLMSRERQPFWEKSKMFMQAASCDDTFEKIGLSLTHYDSGSFDDVEEKMLLFEKEKVYYDRIKRKTLKKITDELAGVNEYGREESVESRRFIYTDDSCLSLCHFQLRGQFLHCEFYLRSSETKETLQYDMNFMKYLAREVYKDLSYAGLIKMCKLSLKIGSRHIIT